jgi:hypothetical protein
VKKIPVGKTIAYAYNFVFGHLGAIIGLIWLPMILIAVLSFLPYALGTVQYGAVQDINEASRGAAINLACSIGTFILYAMLYVVVTRQALGLRHGGASIHFSLGMPEWRMLGAMFLMAVVIVFLILAYAAVSAIAVFAASQAGTAAEGVAVLLAASVGLGLLLFVALRLGFLLAPVVVAEETMSISRSWTLSNGNFLPMFAIVFAIVLPFVIVQFAAMLWVAGPDAFAPLPAGADFATALQQRMQIFDRHMPVLLGLSVFLAPFSLGLNLGAQAFAYRVLVPARPGLPASGDMTA